MVGQVRPVPCSPPGPLLSFRFPRHFILSASEESKPSSFRSSFCSTCAVASVFSVRIFAHRSSFYEIVTTQRNPSSRRYEEHCVFHITFNSMLLSRGGCSSIAVPVEILRQFTQLDRLSNVVAVWILQRETRSRGVIVKQFRKHPSVSRR